MSNEKILVSTLKNDNWKNRDSFCGVYLFDSAKRNFQIILNVMTNEIKVLKGEFMNETVWTGTPEEFLADYDGYKNGVLTMNGVSYN